ncbi:MAG: hypothetical protein RLZZ312_457 [Bacteroidota bacterium]|jgi:hypothetical protein
MNRRELIKNIAIISGGLFIGSNYLLSSCKRDDAGIMTLSPDLLALLSEVAETIIPETDTVGAKTTKVAEFIGVVFQDIYTEQEQKDFIAALEKINKKANELHKTDFAKCTTEQRIATFNACKNKDDKGFLAMYQIVLFAHLTSEQGMKSSFRYTPVPGKYVGDIPYKKGDKAFVGLDG